MHYKYIYVSILSLKYIGSAGIGMYAAYIIVICFSPIQRQTCVRERANTCVQPAFPSSARNAYTNIIYAPLAISMHNSMT